MCKRTIACVLSTFVFVVTFVSVQENPRAHVVRKGTVDTTGKSGAHLFADSCAACHGLDGKGKEATELGFDVPTPDFTDCQFAPREPNADWVTVAHEGASYRGHGASVDIVEAGSRACLEVMNRLIRRGRRDGNSRAAADRASI